MNETNTPCCTEVPTWDELVEREPRLIALLTEARILRRRAGPDFDGLAAFCGYGGFPGFKGRLSRLVGWGRPGNDPVLTSSGAYDTAYQTILGALEGDDAP